MHARRRTDATAHDRRGRGRWVALIAVALALLVAPAPASAGRATAVSLEEPIRVSSSAVRLDGAAPAGARVALLALRDGAWRRVARTRADDAGAFGFLRILGPATTSVRARSAGALSAPRDLPARSTSDPDDACGAAVAKPGGETWSCVLADDFDGDELDPATWFVHDGVDQGGGCMVDDPSTVSVADGALRLSVRPAEGEVPCAGSTTGAVMGQVSTYWRFSQQYGRFEVRMRNQAHDGPGLHEAFWLWPDVRHDTSETYWPAAGEIDVVETYSLYDDLAIPFLHYTANDNGGPVPGTNTAWDCRAERGAWHVYTLEWTADRLEIDVDGRTCLVNTSGDQAFDKRYIIALTQALGVGDNAPRAGVVPTATTLVDYVRVWE